MFFCFLFVFFLLSFFFFLNFHYIVLKCSIREDSCYRVYTYTHRYWVMVIFVLVKFPLCINNLTILINFNPFYIHTYFKPPHAIHLLFHWLICSKKWIWFRAEEFFHKYNHNKADQFLGEKTVIQNTLLNTKQIGNTRCNIRLIKLMELNKPA